MNAITKIGLILTFLSILTELVFSVYWCQKLDKGCNDHVYSGCFEYRCFQDGVHFISFVNSGGPKGGNFVIRAHPRSSEPDGWGTSWYPMTKTSGAKLGHVSSFTVESTNGGILVKVNGGISHGVENSVGTSTFSGTFKYEKTLERVYSGGIDYTFSLNPEFTTEIDMNLEEFTSNRLCNVKCVGDTQYCNTGDMEKVVVTGGLSLTWTPDCNEYGSYPQDLTSSITVNVIGERNIVEGINVASKPSKKLTMNCNFQFYVGFYFDVDKKQDFSADNTAIMTYTKTSSLSSGECTYNFESTPIPKEDGEISVTSSLVSDFTKKTYILSTQRKCINFVDQDFLLAYQSDYSPRKVVITALPDTGTLFVGGRAVKAYEEFRFQSYYEKNISLVSELSFCHDDVVSTDFGLRISNLYMYSDNIGKVSMEFQLLCDYQCENGLCVSRNNCSCHEGWRGVKCDEPICEGCRNGACTSPGNCTCQDGWEGSKCDVPICERGCADGVCVLPELCECKDGWMPPNCTIPICHGCDTTNGRCTSPFFCECDDNDYWKGENCTDPVCSANECNADNGVCVFPHVCECLNTSDWEGYDCNTPVCTSGECNTQMGECKAPHKCSCNEPLDWKGNCNIPICLDKECNFQTGDCTAPHECVCKDPEKWGGNDCSTPVCNPVCINGGKCSVNHNCSCTGGYYGESCEKFFCETRCVNGDCVGPNSCRCNSSGWTGISCNEFSCEDLDHCSNHGDCDGPNHCLCEKGWRGEKCEQFFCTSSCSGKGYDCIGPESCGKTLCSSHLDCPIDELCSRGECNSYCCMYDEDCAEKFNLFAVIPNNIRVYCYERKCHMKKVETEECDIFKWDSNGKFCKLGQRCVDGICEKFTCTTHEHCREVVKSIWKNPQSDDIDKVRCKMKEGLCYHKCLNSHSTVVTKDNKKIKIKDIVIENNVEVLILDRNFKLKYSQVIDVLLHKTPTVGIKVEYIVPKSGEIGEIMMTRDHLVPFGRGLIQSISSPRREIGSSKVGDTLVVFRDEVLEGKISRISNTTEQFVTFEAALILTKDEGCVFVDGVCVWKETHFCRYDNGDRTLIFLYVNMLVLVRVFFGANGMMERIIKNFLLGVIVPQFCGDLDLIL